jgi:hypothetical protein
VASAAKVTTMAVAGARDHAGVLFMPLRDGVVGGHPRSVDLLDGGMQWGGLTAGRPPRVQAPEPDRRLEHRGGALDEGAPRSITAVPSARVGLTGGHRRGVTTMLGAMSSRRRMPTE